MVDMKYLLEKIVQIFCKSKSILGMSPPSLVISGYSMIPQVQKTQLNYGIVSVDRVRGWSDVVRMSPPCCGALV